jgi:hypothetical protein
MEKNQFPLESLTRKTTIEEVEDKEITKRGPRNYIWLREWRKFKSSMKPGDELWEYYATIGHEEVEVEEEGKKVIYVSESGDAGYVILRQGESIAEFVTFHFD